MEIQYFHFWFGQRRVGLHTWEEDLSGLQLETCCICTSTSWLADTSYTRHSTKFPSYGNISIFGLVEGGMGHTPEEVFFFWCVDGRLAALHINFLKMQAFWLMLQAFQDSLRGQQHNLSCLVNKWEWKSVLNPMPVGLQIHEWAALQASKLMARYILVSWNILTDWPSQRSQVVRTVSLDPQVAERFFDLWGSTMINLFATRCRQDLPFPSPRPMGSDGGCILTSLGQSSCMNISTSQSPPQGDQ